MNECIEKVKENAINILYDSGKFIEQIGLYEQCNQDQMNYTLSLIKNKTTQAYTGLYMGLCLPSQCNQTMIRTGLDAVLSALRPTLMIGDIIPNPQDLIPETSWLYYPLLVLIMIIILTSLVSTLLSKHLKYNNHKSTAMKILGSFDLHQTMKIFAYKANVFNVFNGIKSICMFWVIFGHEFSVRLKNNINEVAMPVQIQTWFYLFVIGAFFAVDVFFFLGGFLVAYSFLREKSKNPLKYPLAIVHRILRFWPSYLMTILIFYAFIMHSGSGPVWWNNQALTELDNCQSLWKPMFFVDNLVDNGEKMCLGWGWYLQNDMQIFIFSMIYLFIYSKHKLATNVSIFVTILLSVILNFVEVQSNDYIQVIHLKDFAKWGEYFPNIYIKPWTRCPPYLIGLFFGIQYMQYLSVVKKRKQVLQQRKKEQHLNRTSMNNQQLEPEHENKNLPTHIYISLKQKMIQNKSIIYAFQILGVAIMLFVLLIPRTLQVGGTWPQTLHSTYLSMGKVAFVLGLYLMILPSLLDIPNFTFFIMDTKVFNAFSKISFWTYLIHYMVVLQVTYSQKLDFYYTVQDILPLYIPIAAISVTLGFLGTIFIQVPFAKMEKMLMTALMARKKTKQVQNKSSLTDTLNASLKQSVQSASTRN